MVCLSLCCSSINQAIEQIQLNRDYIHAVELRADYLHPAEYQHIPQLQNVLSESAYTSILTMRRTIDGGQWLGDEATRMQFLHRYYKYFTFCDIEHNCNSTLAPEHTIRSLHDYQGIPHNLEATMRTIGPAAIIKAAVMLNSTADLIELFGIAKNLVADKMNFILIGMGSYGVATRVLASRMGSVMTFVSHDDNAPAAPGHISAKVMATQYRYSHITKSTAIFGIIGNPVLHSRSPEWHNTVFSDNATDAVYIPFQLDAIDQLPKLVATMNMAGLSVTVPHKTAILPFLDTCTKEVVEIGSCNTVICNNDTLHGYNTDAPAFYTTLEQYPDCKKAAVIGAGGAAGAIVYALTQNGFHICIFNRNIERARTLAKRFPGVQAAALDDYTMLTAYSELIVQCTSKGMNNNPGDPIAGYDFTGREYVYDIIYAPPYTPLLQRAKAAGCIVINGFPMLHGQAAMQSRLFRENLP